MLPDPYLPVPAAYYKDTSQSGGAKLLAEAIPTLSRATGRNAIDLFDGGIEIRNYDLMGLKNDDDAWPQDRLANDKELDRWLHGDAKDIAYRYNYLLWKNWVNLGGLK